MFKVGDRVLFGRGKGEKTLGEVVKVNRKNLKVKTLESRGRSRRGSKVGAVWTVAPKLCQPLSASRASWLAADLGLEPSEKRSEEAIMMDIRGVYAALGMDMPLDIGLTEAGTQRYSILKTKLDGYFAELGLEVFKSEAFDPEFLEAVKRGNRSHSARPPHGHLRAEYVEKYRKSRGEDP